MQIVKGRPLPQATVRTAPRCRSRRPLQEITAGFTLALIGAQTPSSAPVGIVRLARDTGAADILGIWEFEAETTSEDIVGPNEAAPICCPVAAGSALYVDVDGANAEAMNAMVYAA